MFYGQEKGSFKCGIGMVYLTMSVLHWSMCVMQVFTCSHFNDEGCGITVTKLLSQFVYICILADNH